MEIKYPFAFWGLILSIGLYFLVIAFDLDLFEQSVRWLESLEDYEMDEFIIPLFLLVVFVSLEFFRQKEKQHVLTERVRVYRAMLASAHHVLNNFLNQMQIFKMEAQNSKDFDAETLSTYDQIAEEAQKQLKALADIKEITEKDIHDSVDPK